MKQAVKQTPSPEFDFFVHERLVRYEGKYVALLGKKVVSAGDNAKEVWDEARKKYPRSIPTIAKVPKQDVLVH